MNKKVKVIFLTIILSVIMAIPTIAIAHPTNEVPQRVEGGVTFVPFRFMAYAHGATVDWDSATRTANVVFTDGTIWTFEIDVLVDEVGGFIAAPGTTWIPLGAAIELFSTASEAIELAKRPQIHGMLTRIGYGDNVAYIFGSMHAGHPDWFPLHDMVESAMARSDVFAFEVDLSSPMDDIVLAEMAALQVLPDGLTLEDILPTDIFESFLTNFETFNVLGLEYEDIAHLTPAALMATLEIIINVGILGGDMELSVDTYIADFAMTHDKPIIGFETFIGQARKFFGAPLEIQAYALVDFPDFDTMLGHLANLDLTGAYATLP